MRPRKKLCILATNEQTESRLRFLLDIHLFAVFASTDSVEITARLQSDTYDALLVESPLVFDVRELGLNYRLPVIEFGVPQLHSFADRVVKEGDHFAARLVEAVKIATARKRGPKAKYILEATVA